MPAFVSWLIGIIMNFFWGKVAAEVAVIEKDKADHEKAVNQAAQDNEKATHINEGSTSSAVDEAIDDSLKHL